MFSKLFSRSEKIKKLVGSHTEAVADCYRKYQEVLGNILEGCSQTALATYTEEMRQLESKADTIRREIIRELLEAGLVVDSRKSVMHVIEAVDGVADLAEDIIQEIYIQNIQLPEVCHGPMLSIIKLTEKQLHLLISIVRSIVDKYNAEEMTRITLEIEGLESQVDRIQQGVIRELFKDEALSLAEKRQYKEIVNMAGHISDLIEDISDEVEIVMLARKV